MEDKQVPVLVANYAPFRLVLRDADTWSPKLEEINSSSYDYVKLSRLSMFLDVDIKPFSLGITFDGSLILPLTSEFHSKEAALVKFNETLGYLLLGGVYCEAVHPTDIAPGGLFTDGYLHQHSFGPGMLIGMHGAFRFKKAGMIDVIKLLNPLTISVSEMEGAYRKGKKRFEGLSGLSPVLLLNGISHYVTHQWQEALVFLWTTIEQIINKIWNNQIFRMGDSEEPKVPGRKEFLQDFRTWSTSAKTEVLFQRQLINASDYKLINTSRKIRNNFMHSGIELKETDVNCALKCLFNLLSLVASDYKNREELQEIEEMIVRNQRHGLFPAETSIEKKQVTHWTYFPPLPGSSNWKGEYEIIDELILRPFNSK